MAEIIETDAIEIDKKKTRQKLMDALIALGELRLILAMAQDKASKELDAQNEKYCAEMARRIRNGLPLPDDSDLGKLPIKTMLLVDAIREAQDILRRFPSILAKVDSAGGFS